MKAPCDCCGASAWEHLFTLSGADLGRCAECALHYVAGAPSGDHPEVTSAEVQLEFELQSRERLTGYVDLARRHAPDGPWLDVGCGAGTLIRLASERGIEAEGIELAPDRLELARRVTGATIHDRSLEQLAPEPGSLAAVTMIDVFSHLDSPGETLTAVHRALAPGGVLLLHTSEVGEGARPHHQPAWELGEHRFFLGEGTIERYAARIGYEVVDRRRVWLPDTVFTRERFRMRGRSRARDAAKRLVLHTPGAFRTLRWYMVERRQADNPIHASTIVLRKTA